MLSIKPKMRKRHWRCLVGSDGTLVSGTMGVRGWLQWGAVGAVGVLVGGTISVRPRVMGNGGGWGQSGYASS